MRFRYIEPGENWEPVEIIVTEQEVIDTYYPYYCEQMIRAGKEHLISKEACLEDFQVVHWAEKEE